MGETYLESVDIKSHSRDKGADNGLPVHTVTFPECVAIQGQIS